MRHALADSILSRRTILRLPVFLKLGHSKGERSLILGKVAEQVNAMSQVDVVAKYYPHAARVEKDNIMQGDYTSL